MSYFLFHFNLKWFHSINSLFTKGTSFDFLAILVYVDDILLVGPNPTIIKYATTLLHNHFKLKDLGLELSRLKHGIFLSQRHYILSILSNCGMMGCKPSSIPMMPNNKLHISSRDPLPDPDIYRRLIGKLLYLTISRLGICFIVHKFSQFLSK